MGSFTMRIQGANATTSSGGYAETMVINAGPTRLYSVTAYNKSASTVYLQVFNTTAVPATGAWAAGVEPKLILNVPADNNWAFDFQDGRIFPVGCVVVASSSNTEYTAVGSNEVIFDATFRAIPG